jgi:dephospho-CoA kinase
MSQYFGTEVGVGGDFLNRFKIQSFCADPKLIGLTGRARSGKDTVGQMLKDGFGAQTVAFADPIREMLRVLGLTHEHFHGTLKEVEHPLFSKSPRVMMQTLGTEWGRNLINEKIWLKIAQQRIEEIHAVYGDHVVVTDVRFDDEAEMIRSMGGVIWHVHRPGHAIADSGHTSESGIRFRSDLGDIVIVNDDTLDALLDEVIDNFDNF